MGFSLGKTMKVAYNKTGHWFWPIHSGSEDMFFSMLSWFQREPPFFLFFFFFFFFSRERFCIFKAPKSLTLCCEAIQGKSEYVQSWMFGLVCQEELCSFSICLRRTPDEISLSSSVAR